MHRTGEWWLDHPWHAITLFAGIAIAGGLTGIAAVWITTSTHIVSADNTPAGFGMASGGALLGLLAGLLAVWRVNTARSR